MADTDRVTVRILRDCGHKGHKLHGGNIAQIPRWMAEQLMVAKDPPIEVISQSRLTNTDAGVRSDYPPGARVFLKLPEES